MRSRRIDLRFLKKFAANFFAETRTDMTAETAPHDDDAAARVVSKTPGNQDISGQLGAADPLLAGRPDTGYQWDMTSSSPFLMSLPRHFRSPVGKVPFKVRVSHRARRLALRIDAQADAVELVLPRRTSLPRALSFIQENRGWLEARINALPPRTPLADGASVPILGVSYRIRIMQRQNGRHPVWIDGNELRIVAEPDQIAKKICDFLRERARAEFTKRSHKLAEAIGKEVGRITVRDTTTRWGSCSANGNLAFSWRLVMAPEAVLHYVVAHEVAHLAEMNHGPRFWKLVDRLAPGSEKQRDWLNRHRARLLRIG